MVDEYKKIGLSISKDDADKPGEIQEHELRMNRFTSVKDGPDNRLMIESRDRLLGYIGGGMIRVDPTLPVDVQDAIGKIFEYYLRDETNKIGQ